MDWVRINLHAWKACSTAINHEKGKTGAVTRDVHWFRCPLIKQCIWPKEFYLSGWTASVWGQSWTDERANGWRCKTCGKVRLQTRTWSAFLNWVHFLNRLVQARRIRKSVSLLVGWCRDKFCMLLFDWTTLLNSPDIVLRLRFQAEGDPSRESHVSDKAGIFCPVPDKKSINTGRKIQLQEMLGVQKYINLTPIEKALLLISWSGAHNP